MPTSVECRIVRIAGVTAAIERRLVGRVERGILAQAPHQIRIRDEGPAERHGIGVTRRDRRFGIRLVVIVVDDPGAAATGVRVRRLQRGVIEGRITLGVVPLATGRTFDDVHEGQTERRQHLGDMCEQRLRIGVVRVVRRRDR